MKEKREWLLHNFITVVILAGIYCFVGMTTSSLLVFSAHVSIRPVSAFSPAFGFLFGWAGGIGCATGDLVMDLLMQDMHHNRVVDFLIQLLYAMFPYLIWRIKDKTMRINNARRYHRYLWLVTIDAIMALIVLFPYQQIALLDEESEELIVLIVGAILQGECNCVLGVILGVPIIMLVTYLRGRKENRILDIQEKFVLYFILTVAASACTTGFVVAGEFEDTMTEYPDLEIWAEIFMGAFITIWLMSFVIVLILWYLEKKVTGPIKGLADIARMQMQTTREDIDRRKGTSEIDAAELQDVSHAVEIKKRLEPLEGLRNEVGDLARAYHGMLESQRLYVENIRRIQSEKEKMAAELSVAQNIQRSLLPIVADEFADAEHFDVYASMNAAKEVGGDLYDVFFVDEKHLALVIADVSGKGIPAALFMMRAKTLIKAKAETELSPGAVFYAVNNRLCEHNEEEMFVTAWMGILDIESGRMVCTNAGHEFPAVKRAGGEFSLYNDYHNFVLAGMEDMPYQEYTIDLAAGDEIFVYTDGVAEATNSKEELFGTERMLQALNQKKEDSCETQLRNLFVEVMRFTGEAPQFDDVTMLALRWKG